MILYRKVQITGENHPCKGLWYARPVINETLDLEALSKHTSKHTRLSRPASSKGCWPKWWPASRS